MIFFYIYNGYNVSPIWTSYCNLKKINTQSESCLLLVLQIELCTEENQGDNAGEKRLIDIRCTFFTYFTLSSLTSSVVRRLQKSRYHYFVGKKTVPLKKEMGALTSQSQLRSTSRSLQWSQVYLAPRSHPWHSPSFHPRRRGWNVMKVNCSQPPFAASVRHCPGLLSSFQSLSLFSSQAVLSKSPFGCAKVCVCVCECECMYACVCLLN